MKRLILFTMLSVLIASSCTKESKIAEVRYEVSLINATSWQGAYVNQNAQVVGISSAPNNWQHSFKNTQGLTVATIQAYPDGTNSSRDALMKIYVNGKVVAEGYSSVSPQLQYLFP